jgi:hypothetical protein
VFRHAGSQPASTKDIPVDIVAPNRASTVTSSARKPREVLLNGCWDARRRNSAATPKALVIFIIDYVREHPDFVALRLEGLVTWLGSIRDLQPEDGGKLAVGRAEVNRLIDKIVAAYDATTTTMTNSAKAGSAKAA